jgi:hypothetical protein
MGPYLERAELRRRRNEATGVVWLGVGAVALLSLAFEAALDYLFYRSEQIGASHHVWIGPIGHVAIFVGVGWATVRRMRQVAPACPACGHLLLFTQGAIAMATGRCPECGERVLAES